MGERYDWYFFFNLKRRIGGCGRQSVRRRSNEEANVMVIEEMYAPLDI
jgi:hypothetical protein